MCYHCDRSPQPPPPLLAYKYWSILGCAEDAPLLTSRGMSAGASNTHLESEELSLQEFLNSGCPHAGQTSGDWPGQCRLPEDTSECSAAKGCCIACTRLPANGLPVQSDCVCSQYQPWGQSKCLSVLPFLCSPSPHCREVG